MFDKFIRKIKRKIIDRLVVNLPSYTDEISYYNMKTLHTAFFNYGACDEIMNHFALLEKSHWQWQHGHNHQWLVYIAALLEKGDEAKAKSVLRTYYSVHGLKDIYRILPVAEFAHRNRYSDPYIEKAAFIYSTFRKNIDGKILSKYLSDKSIAVVGNGPQETGKGKGKEIDRHDVVIRFNLFKTDGYERDYGSKTDIWAKGAQITASDKKPGDFDFVIYGHVYNRLFLRDEQFEEMYQNCLDIPDKLIYLCNQPDWPEYFNSTTGCRVIDMIYKELGSLEKVDIYGMSFPYRTDTDLNHFFDENKDNSAHNMYVELAFLRDLYYVRGGGQYMRDNYEKSHMDENY